MSKAYSEGAGEHTVASKGDIEKLRKKLAKDQEELRKAAGLAKDIAVADEPQKEEGFWEGVQRKAGEFMTPPDEPTLLSSAIAQQTPAYARALDAPETRGVKVADKPYQEPAPPPGTPRRPTQEEIAAASGPMGPPAADVPQAGGEVPAPTPAGLPQAFMPGTGGAIAPIRRSEKQGMEFLKKAAQEAQEVGDEVAKADMKAAQIASQLEMNKANLAEQKFQHQQELVGQMEDFEGRKQELIAQAQTNLEDARANFRHFGITPEERRHHQSIIDSPFTDDEQKARSQEALQKSQSLDPNKALGGGAGQVMALIATAIFGGKLPGLGQVVNMLMQRDMQAQKAKGQAARIAYKQERDNYQDLLNKLGSDEAAMLAMRDMKLEAAQNLWQREHANLTSEQFIANSEKMGALLEQERVNNQTALQKSLHGLAHQGALQESRIRASVQQRREAMAAGMLKGRAAQAEEIEGLVPTGKTTRTAKGNEKVREFKSGTDGVMMAINEALKLRDQVGGEAMGEHKETLLALQAEITTGLSQIGNSGVLNESEFERFSEQVGDLTRWDWLTEKTTVKLNNLMGRFKRAQDAKFRAYGWAREEDVAGREKAAQAAALGAEPVRD